MTLPRSWSASLDYTWNRNSIPGTSAASTDFAAVGAAIESGELNLFRDTNIFGADFSPYLYDVPTTTDSNTTLGNAALRASGPLWTLPGGEVKLSMLAEHRNETFGAMRTVSPPSFVVVYSKRSQSVDSAYVEFLAPLFSQKNKRPGLELLEVQLAGRWDSYTTNGANSLSIFNGVPLSEVDRETNRFRSVDPTVGLRYKPLPGLMFRGSYGTGYLPPAVNQLVPGAPIENTVATSQFFGMTDPLRGGEYLGEVLGTFTLLQGGNPDLNPEESESWSAGVVLEPGFAPGLRLSADWTRIEKTGAIGTLNAYSQDDIDLMIAVAPGRIVRADAPDNDPYTVGPITLIDMTLLNLNTALVEVLDLTAEYRWQTRRAGTFTLSGSASHVMNNHQQVSPISEAVESAGVLGNTNWRANAALNWDYRSWTGAWNVRYYNSYFVRTDHSIPSEYGSATVPSQAYHDLFVGYRFDSAALPVSSLLSGMQVRLGIDNVFDKNPPVDLSFVNLYSALGDPRGIGYRLSLSKAF